MTAPRKFSTRQLTRDEMQKVADAMNMTVYLTKQGAVTNPVGLEIIDTVEPTVNTKTVPREHGLGDSQAHDYATPGGDGSGKLT